MADKAERGLAAIVAASTARAERLAEAQRRHIGLEEFRCRFCGRVLFEYLAPIGRVLQRCRRCGEWSELTTEASHNGRGGGRGEGDDGAASVRGPEHATGDGV